MYKTKSSATAEIARVGGHYAVRGHSRLAGFDNNRKTLYCFVLVNNINLHSISHRFWVIAQSKYRLWQGDASR